MKRLFWIVIFSLFSMAGFSQDIFEGISGLKFLSTDTLNTKNVFVWQNDTIQKDSLVYADINSDCVRFRYINGTWTKWFCDSDIKKALNHVDNDQDTIKTNELITNVIVQNDSLEITEQGYTWKVKIKDPETDPVFNAWNKDYNDLTNKPTLFSGDYNDLTNKPTITPGYNQSASYNKSTHIFSIIDANGSVSDTIPLATNVVDGLMSKEDKAKLDSDTDQSPENELNTNLIFDVETKELSITDAGGTRSVTIDINVGNAVNSYVGKIDVVSSTISVTWPDSFSTTNYFLRIDPYYVETIGGKSIRISNAVYDFVKTVSGFSLKLDTVAGFVEYFAADTTNIYPLAFGNYIEKNAPITPGTNTKITYDAKGLVTGSTSATATDIVNTPSGNVSSTNVQTAINEIDTEKKITSISFTSSAITTTQGDGTTATVSVPTFNQNTTGQAGYVANSQTIKFDTGTTEGTDLYTFNGSSAKTIDIKAGTNITLTKSSGSITIASTATGGTSGIWTALTGTYASATTFTFSGTDKDVGLVEMSLLTCTNSAGTTRRIGYVKSTTNSSGTIICNVVTDTDLASGDKDFKVAYNQKVLAYEKPITINGECIADASYPQGMWYSDIAVASYLLPVDFSVKTAASGSGSALTVNVYKNSTNLFSSAPDLTTNTVLRSQRPTTNTISAGETVSLRILSSAGATNKAADLQAKLYIVPQNIYTAF